MLFCMALPGVAAWWSLLRPFGSFGARGLRHDLRDTAGIWHPQSEWVASCMLHLLQPRCNWIRHEEGS